MFEVLSGPYTLKQIFDDHWDGFVARCKRNGKEIRPAVLENVQKVRDCRDPNRLGYHRYTCPNGCDEVIVPHTCKSRFCSSCGKVATDRWMEERMADLLDVPYHHIVFTIPQELWGFFAWERSALGILFTCAKDTVLSICREQYGYTPGIIMVQHTFGSVLNFNTHIHLLVTDGGLSKDKTRWVENDFLPWDTLKAQWKYRVVTGLKPIMRTVLANGSCAGWYARLGDPRLFFSFWDRLYRKTWYVWYGKKLDNASFTTRYIGRYAKRPAMAESRIRDYDGETVVFEYEDKKEGVHRIVRLPVRTFLTRLIRHIHQKHYRVIRYAGMYATRVKAQYCTIARLLLKLREKRARPKVAWRERRIQEWGDDPLECRHCGSVMVLQEIVYRARDGPSLRRVSG